MLLELVFLRLSTCLYLLTSVCVHICVTASVCVYVCVCVSGAPVCAEGERVKPIDYFNPPICESVILSAQPSTGGLLIGLNASLLSRALPVQLT